VHSYESSSAAINCLANVLGAVLKQYNSTPASRIRPQSFNTGGYFFQSCISFGDLTILSSKIQASTYGEKGYHKDSK
jgi:hypothetical protein